MMTLQRALDLRRHHAAKRPNLTYVVRRNGRRSLRVSPFYVAVSGHEPRSLRSATPAKSVGAPVEKDTPNQA